MNQIEEIFQEIEYMKISKKKELKKDIMEIDISKPIDQPIIDDEMIRFSRIKKYIRKIWFQLNHQQRQRAYKLNLAPSFWDKKTKSYLFYL